MIKMIGGDWLGVFGARYLRGLVGLTLLLVGVAQAQEMGDEADDKDVYALTEYESLLPQIELTPAVMTTILSAELAFKNGDWDRAYKQYMALDKQYRDPRLARRATEIALLSNQLAPAIAAARVWVEQSPTLAPYYDQAVTTLLRLYLQAGRYSEAAPLLRRRLHVMHFDEVPIAPLFDEILRIPDKKGVLSFLQKELAAYQRYADVHIVLAQAALAADQPQLAESEAQKVLAIEPDSERAIVLFTQLSSDKPRVLRVLKDAVAKNPTNEKLRSHFAQQLIEARDYPTARAQYVVLLEQNPAQSRYLYVLGLASLDAKDIEEAKTYLKRFLAADNKGIDDSYLGQARNILADLYAKEGDYLAALEALGEQPNQLTYLPKIVRRANLLAQAGQAKAGRALIQAVPVENDEELKLRLLTEVQFLREQKDYASAFEILRTSEKKFSTDSDLLYEYALTAEAANQFPLMEKKLRALISAAPEDYRGYNALGYALADRNIRLAEAQVLLNKAVALADDNPFVLDSMGWLQFRQGDLVNAEKTLNTAYRLRSDGEIAIHLVEVLWASNKKEQARELLRQLDAETMKTNTFKETTKRLNISL